jgi:hypothetical protein
VPAAKGGFGILHGRPPLPPFFPLLPPFSGGGDSDGDQGDRIWIGLLKGGHLGFVAQVDGGDLQHSCPGACGAHPVVGEIAMGAARRHAPRRVTEDAEGKKSNRGEWWLTGWAHMAVIGGEG